MGRFAITEGWTTDFAYVIGLELVDVSCFVADVAAEAAEGDVAADVDGVAAAAVAVGMVSSNVGVLEDLTCDDNLGCHYQSSHLDVGGLRIDARLGAPDHMLMTSVAARLEGELISGTHGGNVRCFPDAE